jgi:hypothetical protein
MRVGNSQRSFHGHVSAAHVSTITAMCAWTSIAAVIDVAQVHESCHSLYVSCFPKCVPLMVAGLWRWRLRRSMRPRGEVPHPLGLVRACEQPDHTLKTDLATISTIDLV